METATISEARELLEKLAKRGAVLAVGGFDLCDPCVAFISFPPDVRPQMEAFVKETYENGYEDEDQDDFEASFGWTDHSLADEDLDELAKDLIRDLRLDDLKEMAENGEGYTVTVPLP